MIPYLVIPEWCADHFSNEPHKLFYNCHDITLDSGQGPGVIRYSNFPMMNGTILLIIELVSVILLTMYRLLMTKYKDVSRKFWFRNYVLFACVVYQLILLIIDLAFGVFVLPYNYIVRPIVIIIFLSNVRARFYDILTFLGKSVVILFAVFGYVLFSAALFYFLYKATF